VDDRPAAREIRDSSYESSLRHEVELARGEYESAIAEVRKLMEQARDLSVQPPDGAGELRRAIDIQRHATRRYSNSLKALSAFVLDNIPKCR
jgi:hypothetical protein